MFSFCFCRKHLIALATALLMLSGAHGALAVGIKSDAKITVVFTANCDGATIVSSKDISNVVVILGEDKVEAFEEGKDFGEGLTEVTLAPDSGFDGRIETVYINADSIKSSTASESSDIPGEPFHCGQSA